MPEPTPTPDEQPTALPDVASLADLDAEALDAAEQSAADEVATIRETPVEEMTDEQVDRLNALADYVEAVDTQRAANEQAAAERTERANAAISRLDGGDGDNEGEGDEPPAEGDGDDEGDEAPADEAPAPQSVAASAGRRAPSVGTLARSKARRRDPVPSDRADEGERGFSIVASAETGVGAGTVLPDLLEAAKAFQQRSKGFPEGISRTPNVRYQHSVASIHRRMPEGFSIGEKTPLTSIETILRNAADERRLKGPNGSGSLVAAGGWCAPSENMYGLTSMETLDGILDIPEVTVPRGGINYTPGPDFSDIYTSAGFVQTEAEAIAGDTKACVEVDCPDFAEVRLDAVGYCVKAPLLTRSAYPEVIQRWLEGTIVAQAHKMNARKIASMRTALGTALAPTLTGTPTTWGLVTILEWVIEMQRQAYRLSEGQTLEVVLPRWVRVAIRADLANRAAVGADSVSNEQIAAHFAHRGARVQFVLGYLEVSSPTTSVAFPATAEMMVYPAGTFVAGVQDVISLDTVYDTADLQTNVYTAAFVEDGLLIAKMQHGGKRITFPINSNGMMGSLQIDDNIFTAQAENAGAAA